MCYHYMTFDDTDSSILTFLSNDVGFNSINLSIVNIDDDNYNDCDLETINHVGLMACYNRYKQQKARKKKIDEELLPVAWHPTRVWDWLVKAPNWLLKYCVI